MATIVNKKKLLDTLRRKREHAKRFLYAVCLVGYTASYAIFVHENLEAFHTVGQAKFLEQPAITLRPELRSIITDAIGSGQSMNDALLLAGLRLQAESQLLCPVDTGALRASAFTRLEQ